MHLTATENPLAPFLERFFGEGNDLRWSDVRPSSASAKAEALKPFLREAGADWKRLILPRARANRLTWYAISRDAREGRVLRDELLAFVGPSYSDFRGQYGTLDEADPVDQAVLRFAGRNVFRVDVVDSELKDSCRRELQRLLEVRERRPRGIKPVPRSPGRVMRDFELAVQSRAASEAASYLEELRAQGGTSARNLAFLEVHFHETFEEWSALYAMLEDGALVQAQRPARVTRALIRAVYRRELSAFESTSRPEEALSHFREVVQPRYARLYASLAALDGPEVTKSFLLAAASAVPPRPDRRDALLERYPRSASDRLYVESLARLIPLVVVEEPLATPLHQARAAFAQGDLDQALSILLEQEPSPTVLELLVRSALEIGSIEAASRVIAAVDAAPVDVRRICLDKPRVNKAIDELCKRFAASADAATETRPTPIPQSWLAWIQRLQSEPSWSGALTVAQQAALEWPLEDAAKSPADLAAFAEALRADLSAPASENLLNALPYLLEFFVHRAGSSRLFVPVQTALLDRLLYLEARSLESIRATGVLLDALMRASMKPSECRQAVQDIQTAWLEQPSLGLVDWALDVLDSLVTLQVAPAEAQMGFATSLRGVLIRWRDRLSSQQVALYHQLCREGGFPFEPSDFEASSEAESGMGDRPTPLAARIGGRVVALYSLRTEVLRRTRDVLLSIVPNAEVRLFSDEVGGDALRSSARTADVFVIVTGAAKHAATEFIEEHRPKNAVTLRCHATGTAALLRVLAGE